MGLNSAIIAFTDGCNGVREVVKQCNMEPGKYTDKHRMAKDVARINSMQRKRSLVGKTQPRFQGLLPF